MTTLFEYIQQGFSAIVPFVILLGLLIFVHEMGHFLVAKYFGVRVEVFSLGFGKKIFAKKRGDTTYCISLIPLGGYVKMFGDEAGATIPEEEKKFSFQHKPVFQRIAVVLAGPIMNLIFAILIFFVVAVAGEDVRGPSVGDISIDSVAYKVGFRPGDLILNADNQNIKTWDEFQDLMTQKSGTEINIKIRRETGGQEEIIAATPVLIDNPNILSLSSKMGEISGLPGLSKQAVVGIRSGSVASDSGLMTGDKITQIGSQPIKYFREIDNIMISLQGHEISIQAERTVSTNGKEEQKIVSVTIPSKNFSSMEGLGIEPSELYLYKVIDGTPAAKVGMHANDRILKVNKTIAKTWDDILSNVKSYSGSGTIEFEVERAGATQILQVSPQLTSQPSAGGMGAEEKRYTVGIMPYILLATPLITKVRAESFSQATAKAWNKTWEVTGMTVLSFLRLIQNKISPKNIGGVISIGQAASETYKMGLMHFLQMMAIISINLFILNLLPIPVLDGGHLLFYSIEALKGTPMSMRKMEVAQQFGLVVLMSLMVFALFNDFSRLLGSW